MKNLKTLLTISFITSILCFGTVNAQNQGDSTVIITGFSVNNHTKYKLETVKPNYELEAKEFKIKDGNFHVFMKKELDFWLKKGYQLLDSSSGSGGTNSSEYTLSYILIKKN